MSALLYFGLWAGLIFLMMRFGCGAHVMGHGQHHGDRSDNKAGTGGAKWVPPDKNVDPVCGMTVATTDAKSAVHDGTVFYFCSANCRDKFEATPDKFLSGRAGKPEEMEHHHA
jgi:YHS domain-containing protein